MNKHQKSFDLCSTFTVCTARHFTYPLKKNVQNSHGRTCYTDSSGRTWSVMSCVSRGRETIDLPDTHRAAALWRWSVYSPCLSAQALSLGSITAPASCAFVGCVDMPDMKYWHNGKPKPKRRSGVGLPRGPLVPIIMAAFHRFLHCE